MVGVGEALERGASLEEAHFSGLTAYERFEAEEAPEWAPVPCNRGELSYAGSGRLCIVYHSWSGKKYTIYEGGAFEYPVTSSIA
jgi:hypothetical protein